MSSSGQEHMSFVIHTSSATCYSLHHWVLHKKSCFLFLHLTLYMYSAGSSDTVVQMFKLLRKQLTRVEQGNRSMFYHMFAPTISDMTKRSREIQKNCVKAFNAEGRAPKTLWCMVLGQYLDTQLIKAAHIFKRSWPASIAVSWNGIVANSCHLDVCLNFWYDLKGSLRGYVHIAGKTSARPGIASQLSLNAKTH